MIIAALLVFASAQGQVAADAQPSVAESRRAMAGYAACLVERKGAAVEEMLARPYDDRVEKALRDLHDLSCPFETIDTKYRAGLVRGFGGLLFRGSLYQALVARDLERIRAMPAVAMPSDEFFPSGRMWPGSPAANYRQLIGLGRCLFERDPTNARLLALSAPTSAEEARALEALAVPLGKCGYGKKEAPAARNVLSEIIYRTSINGSALRDAPQPTNRVQ